MINLFSYFFEDSQKNTKDQLDEPKYVFEKEIICIHDKLIAQQKENLDRNAIPDEYKDDLIPYEVDTDNI